MSTPFVSYVVAVGTDDVPTCTGESAATEVNLRGIRGNEYSGVAVGDFVPSYACRGRSLNRDAGARAADLVLSDEGICISVHKNGAAGEGIP